MVTAEDQQPEEALANVPRSDEYTAILYYHGMGTPRRHEEISRLTDALDQFAERQAAASVGRLRNQNVAFEPSRTDQDDVVAYPDMHFQNGLT
jgi:hypothetical protein